MSDRRYTRLKLKMLLLVVAGAVIASAVGLFLVDVVIDGALQDPFARLFVWVATRLFGQTDAVALEVKKAFRQRLRKEEKQQERRRIHGTGSRDCRTAIGVRQKEYRSQRTEMEKVSACIRN